MSATLDDDCPDCGYPWHLHMHPIEDAPIETYEIGCPSASEVREWLAS